MSKLPTGGSTLPGVYSLNHGGNNSVQEPNPPQTNRKEVNQIVGN